MIYLENLLEYSIFNSLQSYNGAQYFVTDFCSKHKDESRTNSAFLKSNSNKKGRIAGEFF